MKGFIKHFCSSLLILFTAGMIACGGGGGGGTPSGGLSDDQITAQDRANLDVQFETGDSINFVTQDITLPSEGANGSDITWESDDTVYLENSGKVNRPAFGSGNIVITLIATITKGESTTTKTFTLTIIETPPTDSEAVAQAIAALQILYAPGDNSSNVTQNISLPLSGANETIVAWESDNTAYITETGTVIQPAYADGNQVVTLTAYVSKNEITLSTTFTLTVLRKAMDDEYAVAQARSALNVIYTGTDNESNVTSDVVLPTAGENGTSITWESNNTSYITELGAVSRPSYLTGNVEVTLTATITKNETALSKTFTLIVIKNLITDSEAVQQATDSLTIGYASGDNASNVTQSVTLATSGSDGTAISWETTDAACITTLGAVTRPVYGAGNKTITLTATISKNGASDSKSFILTVIETPISDSEAVAQAKSALAIGYSSGDSAASVTKNVTLATSGSNGTLIAWQTNNATYITALGAVSRPLYATGDINVLLTATISRNGITDTKEFTLTVKKAMGVELLALTINTATLSPAFDSGVTSYKAYVANSQSTVGITSTVVDPTSWLYVEVYNPASPVTPTNSWPTGSGVERTISLNVGLNHIKIKVCNDDGVNVGDKSYTILIYRTPFVDNGNGTMTDTRTSKMWIKVPSITGMTFTNAQSYATSNSTGSYTDWRVPTETELAGLVSGWYNGWSTMDLPWKFLRSQGFGPGVATYYWTTSNGYYANTKRIIAMATDGATSAGSWVEMSNTDGRPSVWLVRN